MGLLREILNGEKASYNLLKLKIFEFSKLDINVNGVSTEQYLKMYPNQAKRPLNSRLSKKSLDLNGFHRLPSWENALYRFLLELKS